MAIGTLPKPGTKLGPCKEMGCGHRDCAATRRDASTPCRFCAHAIGFDQAFFRSGLSGEMAHAGCLESAAERNDSRVGLF